MTAIEERDFQTFADITIRDSNQFHAICQDTFPPCVYMNQTSHAVSSLVHQLNEYFGENVACYTFDAGPNACLFLLEKVRHKIKGCQLIFCNTILFFSMLVSSHPCWNISSVMVVQISLEATSLI